MSVKSFSIYRLNGFRSGYLLLPSYSILDTNLSGSDLVSILVDSIWNDGNYSQFILEEETVVPTQDQIDKAALATSGEFQFTTKNGVAKNGILVLSSQNLQYAYASSLTEDATIFLKGVDNLSSQDRVSVYDTPNTLLDILLNIPAQSNYTFYNGIVSDGLGNTGLGGQLDKQTFIDLNGNGLMIAAQDFSQLFGIGNLSDFGGGASIFYASFDEVSINSNDIVMNSYGYVSIGANEDVSIGGKNVSTNADNIYGFIADTILSESQSDTYFNSLGSMNVGWYDHVTTTFKMSVDSSAMTFAVNDYGEGGYTNIFLQFNRTEQTYESPLLSQWNFTDDVAAAAGDIPVNGWYHTDGVMKIRLT
jgi:hypothetical protein